MTMVASSAVPVLDPAINQYRMGDLLLPRVTTILKAAGLVDYSRCPEDKLLDAQWRGSAAHVATAHIDMAELDGGPGLDWQTVEAEHQGYVRAWERFKTESRLRITAVEQVVSSRAGYAGTLDRLGLLLDVPAIVDLKTSSGSIQPAAAVQLAAYTMCLDRPFRWRRYAVRLKADGRYSVQEFPRAELPADFASFCHALGIWNWKKDHL